MTKGKTCLRVLFFRKRADCPVAKLSSDSVLRISFLGYPRLLRRNLKLERLSLNVVSEEFVLRSRRAPPLLYLVLRLLGEMCVLKRFSQLVVSTDVKYRVVSESIPFTNDCV